MTPRQGTRRSPGAVSLNGNGAGEGCGVPPAPFVRPRRGAPRPRRDAAPRSPIVIDRPCVRNDHGRPPDRPSACGVAALSLPMVS